MYTSMNIHSSVPHATHSFFIIVDVVVVVIIIYPLDCEEATREIAFTKIFVRFKCISFTINSVMCHVHMYVCISVIVRRKSDTSF